MIAKILNVIINRIINIDIVESQVTVFPAISAASLSSESARLITNITRVVIRNASVMA
jgi:hypothetical protein